ncbi:hypothetical protein QAD02_005115 [Eretmocerus hayati]|uniref:Uncharacterized protein n=1 Tax=Eretmocerus hayati TaxID=131215 RepID=A0ACC2NRL7_9HYME|nr:hypothetical protein QAD02_005115 [Eretmocerus hayati]
MDPQCEKDWKNYQRLQSAIRHGHVEVARRLIQIDVPVNVRFLWSPCYRHLTPLHLAVQYGSLDLIECLLSKGASVNFQNDCAETPLMLSVRLRKFAVTDLLLTADNLDDFERSAHPINHLHIACLRDNIHVIKKLIARGTDVNAAVDNESLHWAGYTPLHFAVENHSIDVVKLLLRSGASIMKKNAKSLTPLHLADLVRDEAIIDILLEAQMFELGNPKDSSGLSHFHIACTRNDEMVVEYFLKQGVNANSRVKESCIWDNFEPIMFAIHYECLDVVKLLLRHGANLTNEYNIDDEGHLKLAYEIGNQQIIDLLVNNRTVKNKLVTVGRSLSGFQLACVRKNLKKIEKFLHGGKNEAPDLNSPLWNGCTPLHYLVRSFPSEAMSLFQYFSGSISVKDSRGKTPLHAFFEHHYGVERQLVPSALMDFEENPSDLDGLTHLHIACTTNQIDWIERFLNNGADVNCAVKNSSLKWSGYTPLHFAVKYCQKHIVDILLKNGAKISLKNGIGSSPFDMAIVGLNSFYHKDKPFRVMLWKMLLEKENSDNDFDSRGFSLLHIVCSTKIKLNPDDLAQYIDVLPGGIDQAVNYPTSEYHKFTALHFAVYSRNNGIAKWLISKGANVHLKNHDGYSPLQHEFDSFKTNDILKDNPSLLRVPENPFDFRGYSYFHHGCILGDRETMEYYLRLGVDINLRTRIDRHGRISAKTSLHLVVNETSENVTDTVKYLIDNGADVMALDAYQNTPLHCMIDHRFNKAVAQLLVDHGADVNAQNFLGETPLYQVCKGIEKSRIIHFLLEYGADINIENDRADTPFTQCHMLSEVGGISFKTVRVLLKHVKRTMLLGMPVSAQNREIYYKFLEASPFHGFDERQIEEKCLKEIQLMKEMRINQYISLHDIISKTPNEMTHLIRNPSLRKLIRSNDFNSNFPLYGYLIRQQFRIGHRRKPLLEKCKTSLQSLANFSSESVEKILDHLDDSDLKNIIASLNIIPCVSAPFLSSII